MEDRSDSETESDTTLGVGVKGVSCSSVELGESGDRGEKRVRVLNLESVDDSEGIATHHPKKFKTIESRDTLPTSKITLLKKDDRKREMDDGNSRSFCFDLNLEEVSRSVNKAPSCSNKSNINLKSRDTSECGSSSVPLEKKDPLLVWKEMKQNGFLSASHSAIIAVPKQRVKKTKKDGLKKKMEIAKKEQVDKFVKMAAPSGLLNKLNPGIITNVRNMKQVHSIIQGLMRSEVVEKSRLEIESKHASQLKSGSKEIVSQEEKCHKTLLGSKHTSEYHLPCKKPNSVNLAEICGDANSCMVDTNICDNSTNVNGEGILALKLPPSTAQSLRDTSAVSTDDKKNSVSCLSVKAATVAFQWLDLLQQDIKGRLASLTRSKTRVRAVINTELNFLLSKEFPSNQDNDRFITKAFASGYSHKAIADLHQVRWSRLFDQMDKALSEEEKLLEVWLKQVEEMHLHCERGLQHNHLNAPSFSQVTGVSENSSRSERLEELEKELAVRAAAASIYSTCNYLASNENAQCL